MKKDYFSKYRVDAKRVVAMFGILIAGFSLGNSCFADTTDYTVTDNVSVIVPGTCSVDADIETGHEHSATIHNGHYVPGIGTTTFTTYCNDFNGYALYAVGYSGDTYGNTKMLHDSNPAFDFNTGTATSGPNSNWAMKLTAESGHYQPIIHSDSSGAYSAYHVVPSQFTKVVSFASNTEVPTPEGTVEGSSFTSTYAVWVSGSQTAGSYLGKVRYVLVHPASAPAPTP